MKTHFNPFLVTLGAIPSFILPMAAIDSAHGANIYWDTNPGTNVWGTSTNWNTLGGSGNDASNPAAAPGVNDVAIFNVASSQSTISVPTTAIGHLTFDAGAGAYTIGTGAANSQTLIMAGSRTFQVNSGVTNHQTLNAKLQLGGNGGVGSYAISNNSTTHKFTLNQIIGGTGGTGAEKSLTVGGAGAIEILGSIATGGASNLTLTKTGSGILTLAGDNTFTGSTTISGGSINLGHANALANSATVIVNSNNGLLFGSLTETTVKNLEGTGTLSLQNQNSSAVALTAEIAASTSKTYSGSISGSGSLRKAGTGTLILSGSNSYTGTTTVAAGDLRIADAEALSNTAGITVNNSAHLSLAGVSAGAGKSVSIQGFGANFFGALQGASGTSEWQGGVTISASGTRIGVNSGELTLSGVIDSGGAAHGITFRSNDANATTLVLSGANTYLGATTLVTGANGVVRLSGGDNRLPTGTNLVFGLSGISGILDLNGNNQEVTGLSVGQSSGTNANEIHSQTAATLTVNNSSASSYSGKISGGIALTKTGASTLTLQGQNEYSGTTTISQGTLALGGAGSISSSTRIDISTAASTFNVTGLTGNYTLAALQELSGNGTLVATGKTVTANGTLSPGSSPGNLTQDGGTLQLGAGGNYNWQIYDATGAAGAGYDTVSLTGGATLDLSLLSESSPYNINLWSLSGINPDANGDALNFNNTLNHSWTLFSTNSVIGGFDPTLFQVGIGATNGTAGFSNNLGGGAFSVGLADGGTDLVLNFTAIPEPETALLGALGLFALLRRRQR
jgi:fibronectin-binding autotransporter adhesin